MPWKQHVHNLLGRCGYRLLNLRSFYNYDGLFTLHNDHFRKQPAFRAAYARGVQASAGHDPQMEWRVYLAVWAAAQALHTEGDFIECGVNAGFVSSAIMQSVNWNNTGRNYYLVDTFAGPPLTQYSEEERAIGRVTHAQKAIDAGAYVTDLHRITSNFAEWPTAQLVQGTVPDILPEVKAERVAFLHLDMNAAAPERAALEYFWPRLTPGAIVLFDDYVYTGHEANTAAIDAAAETLGISVLALPTGQGLIIKR